MEVIGSSPHDRLLLALAEQLKLPVLQIARRAELQNNDDIAYTADVALRLIDSYMLSIMPDQIALELEPVSVASVLQDSAHQLTKLSEQYGCDLEVQINGKYSPVMANRRNLEAAYIVLGYSIIEAQTVCETRPRVVLNAHKSSAGLVAGIFGTQQGLTSDIFRRARALYGSSRQPFTTVSAATGAGIFIADSLMQTMASPLRIAKYNNLTGLASTLIPSHQLKLNVS